MTLSEAEAGVGLRILYVEDMPQSRRIVQRFLEPEHVVVSCETLEAAVAHLATGAWDVVLLDEYLPGGSGIEFIPQVKQLAPDARVFILSGDQARAGEALAAGAEAFISKPFSAQEFRVLLGNQ